MPISCADADILVRNFWFLSVLSLQAVGGYVSIIICLFVARKCRSLHFHVNWRILVITSLSMYIVHSVFIAVLQTTQVIRYLATSEPCSVGLPPLLCISLRYSSTSCMVCFAALQCSMVIERAVAIWKRHHYEHYGPALGITSAFVSIIVSFAVTAWVVRNVDFTSRLFYCSTVTEKTLDRATILTYGLCGIDLITLIGIISLYIFNSYAMKRFRRSFSLQSYQLRENANVIRVMLPLTFFQTLCFFVFSIGSPVIFASRLHMSLVTYNALLASVYVIPYYTAISPIFMWLIIRWSKQMKAIKLRSIRVEAKSEKDIYFKELHKAWNCSTE